MARTARVPIQSKMFDERGNLTREWILFLESLRTETQRVALWVNGTLSAGSNLAAIEVLNEPQLFGSAVAFVKTAPTSAPVTIEIRFGSTLWLTFSIPAGTKTGEATAAQMRNAPAIPAGVPIELHLTSVGSPAAANLAVFLYP